MATSQWLGALALAWLVLAEGPAASSSAYPSTQYDVVVWGSTPAGITAAVAASRTLSGASRLRDTAPRVAVLTADRHVGGMMSGGLGCTDTVRPQAVGGLALEFLQRARAKYPFENRHHANCYRNGTFEPHVAEAVFLEMLGEAAVHTVAEHRLTGVTSGRDGRIACVALTPTPAATTGARASAPVSVCGSVFIDASYEGDLLAAAGVPYTVGRESSAKYGEPNGGTRPPDPSCYVGGIGHNPFPLDPFVANTTQPLFGIRAAKPAPPGSADSKVMAYNYRLCLTNASTGRAEIDEPGGYDAAWFEAHRRILNRYPPHSIHDLLKLYAIANVSDGFKCDVNNADWPFSTDLAGASWAYPDGDVDQRQAVVELHKLYHRSLLWFFKSDLAVPADIRQGMAAFAYCSDEFQDNDHFPYALYVREARRMVSDVVLTEHDTQAAHPLGNASIGLGSYAFDCHPVEIFVVDETHVGLEGCAGSGPRGLYGIPFGAIVPPSSHPNLLVPVCLSASHVAFDSVRVELTWATLGHSSGTAAALAVLTNSTVQGLDTGALHRRLVEQHQVLGP